MIDVHTHLLPQIDDGSQDWDESLAMIRQGIRDGITGAICTPHILNVLDEPFESRVIFKFQQLKELIEKNKLAFKVWLGSEIHCQAVFNSASKMVTLNDTQKYLLIELPLGEMPMDAGDVLFKLSLDGITPILAHPERNTTIMKNRETAYRFVQQGAMIQINAGSITGDFGKLVKQTAFELMDRRMVHFIASDCHNAATRPMLLSSARKLTVQRWGEKAAEALFTGNPQKMIQGEKIHLEEPVPSVSKQSFIKKIFRM